MLVLNYAMLVPIKKAIKSLANSGKIMILEASNAASGEKGEKSF